jgi:thiol-disulfide isomerase/thioredoxin
MVRKFVCLVLLGGFVCLGAASGQTVKPQHTLPDDPAAAWAEVSKVHQALGPPEHWRGGQPTPEEIERFQVTLREAAVLFAGKAREFAERFPNDENTHNARFTVIYALGHAVAAGDDASEAAVRQFLDAVTTDSSIEEEQRVQLFMMGASIALLKSAGMEFFIKGQQAFHEEMDAAMLAAAREAQKRFPASEYVYTSLLASADRANPLVRREIAEDIIAHPGAPPGAKSLARHFIEGTRPYEIGKPLDIRFTALDGREVDLAALKGKVVFIEFWSTTCGPCVAELPVLKAAYEKFHKRGFEVIAISLDQSETALKRFIKDRDLPWPQHFDGKGWGNKFAVEFGIFGIPTKWLVDKRGNLRDTNARGPDVERRIAILLDEQLKISP